MQILIENSEYWLCNNGDLAMLDVTYQRIRQIWPTARIGVLTDSPSLLRAYFPGAEGITVFDRDPWAAPTLTQGLAALLGPRWVGPIALAALRTKAYLPARLRSARRKIARMLFPDRPIVEEITSPRPHLGAQRAVREADLVVALGGGYITDSDKVQTRRVLNLFDHALAHAVPVIMVGQGMGPMSDPALLERCSQVLPRLQMIAVRERRRGPALLDQMGVRPERILVTGDDAIELAYDAARVEPGDGVGICLRVAGYSPVSSEVQSIVGRVVREAAEVRGVSLVPLIIAEYRGQDRRSTLPIVRSVRDVIAPLPRFTSPRAVAARVSECRVVVTGAYHLAVFALAQGIPVVAITSSEYYDDKFLGLGEMFGQGLTLVSLDDRELASELRGAIESAWCAAAEVREPLRGRARDQIALSRRAFDRINELIEHPVTERG